MVTLMIIVLLVAMLYFFTDWFSMITGYSVSEGEKTNVAQCLASKEVVMYGTDSCKYCKKQKSLFGDSFGFINYVECSANVKACIGLEGYPAWKINGNIFYGLKNLDELKQLARC